MNRKGFTLIELMIVVAIIGILAAIAIPNFLAMQLRAKRAELPANLDGIRTAEKAYHAEWDGFTAAAPTPATAPSGRTAIAFATGGYGAFDLLGWVADGKVRGAYSATATGSTGGYSTDNFTATAISNVDGEGSNAVYSCNRAEKYSMISASNDY
jgi:type IV pilus assembly protein PilA